MAPNLPGGDPPWRAAVSKRKRATPNSTLPRARIHHLLAFRGVHAHRLRRVQACLLIAVRTSPDGVTGVATSTASTSEIGRVRVEGKTSGSVFSGCGLVLATSRPERAAPRSCGTRRIPSAAAPAWRPKPAIPKNHARVRRRGSRMSVAQTEPANLTSAGTGQYCAGALARRASIAAYSMHLPRMQSLLRRHRSYQRLEHLNPICASQFRLSRALRMRHHAQHVPSSAADSSNVVE